jgi:hypothetical protein
MFLIGLVLLILVALLGAAIQGSVMELLPWVLLLFWLALIAGGASWLTAWQIRRNNPNMVAGFEHVLSSAGYHVTCGNVDSTVAWSGLVKIVETANFFLLYPTRTSAYYIPKRALKPEGLTAIRTLVLEQVPEKSAVLAV